MIWFDEDEKLFYTLLLIVQIPWTIVAVLFDLWWRKGGQR